MSFLILLSAGAFYIPTKFSGHGRCNGACAQRGINVRVSRFKGAQYSIGPSSHYEMIPVN